MHTASQGSLSRHIKMKLQSQVLAVVISYHIINVLFFPAGSFANLGIQCVRRKELDFSLQKRRSQNIDPFQSKADVMSSSFWDLVCECVELLLQ